MENYFKSLSAEQYNNIGIIISRMVSKGVTNKYAQAAILAVISKESSFKPSFEKGYSTTSNERIRTIFSSTKLLSDTQLDALKKDTEKFFNYVYGNKFGNGSSDGFKYRGGGFNQITFKANYIQAKQDSLVDVVNYPEKINEPEVAADSVIGYFLRRFKSSNRNINAFSSLGEAINDVYQANAGKLGTKVTIDPTGGFAKASGRAAGFYEYVKTHSGDNVNFLKLKAHLYKYIYLYLVFFLLVISLILWKVLKK